MKLPAILTLLGALFAVGVVSAADLVDPQAEGVSAPYLIAGSRVTPSYPPAAYAAKVSGVVQLRATINPDGSVGAIEVLDSSATNMGFEDAAREAIARWRFEPARQADSAVASYTDIRLSFNPPSRGSRGYVASGFGGPISSGGGPVSAALPMKAASTDLASNKEFGGKNRTAWLPIEYKRIYHYGRPPSQLGAVYDRRDLIPPGTGGHILTPN